MTMMTLGVMEALFARSVPTRFWAWCCGSSGSIGLLAAALLIGLVWVSYDLPDRRLLSGSPALSLEELIERGAPLIVLTAEQQAYLQQLGPITLAPDPDGLPYESIDAQGSNGVVLHSDCLATLRC